MEKNRAMALLEDTISIDGLHDTQNYTSWVPGDKYIVLDGWFDPEELEAMIWCVKNWKELYAELKKNHRSSTE